MYADDTTLNVNIEDFPVQGRTSLIIKKLEI